MVSSACVSKRHAGQESRALQRRPRPRYCSVNQRGEDPSTSRLFLRCLLVGRTLATRLIRDTERLPILLRSLQISGVQISDRPKIHGLATYRNDMSSSKETKGSRWISNVRQMRLFSTSSNTETLPSRERADNTTSPWSFSLVDSAITCVGGGEKLEKKPLGSKFIYECRRYK